MSRKFNGYLCATMSLEYSGIPTGDIWFVPIDSDEKNEITVERLVDNARGLFGLAPEVTLSLKFLDDEGTKTPLATEADLLNALTFRTPDMPMRIAVDLPAPPGTPLPPYNKVLHKEKCIVCHGAVRGLRFLCLNCNGDNIVCSGCYFAAKPHQDHPLVVMPLPNEPGRSSDHSVKFAANNVGRQSLSCKGCRKYIFGLRWKCCECDDVDFCDQCVKKKGSAKPVHEPAHHLCPIDQRLDNAAAAQEVCRNYLQALQTGGTRLPMAPGLLLGMMQPGQQPPAGAAPGMPGMPMMMGAPGMMPGMMPGMPAPGAMPGIPQQMPPGQMPGMPQQQTPGQPQLSPAPPGASIVLQGQLVGQAPGQMMPGTCTITPCMQGQPMPPMMPGSFVAQGLSPGQMVIISLASGGAPGQQQQVPPQQPAAPQQMPSQQQAWGQQPPQQPGMMPPQQQQAWGQQPPQHPQQPGMMPPQQQQWGQQSPQQWGGMPPQQQQWGQQPPRQ